jgi:quinol monooxygenase YgiN
VPYIFMAVHYPAPGQQDAIHASMRRMAESMTGTAGLIQIGPWLEYDGDRVVGLSVWESRAAFDAAMPGSGVPGDVVQPGERRPREYFHLTSGA